MSMPSLYSVPPNLLGLPPSQFALETQLLELGGEYVVFEQGLIPAQAMSGYAVRQARAGGQAWYHRLPKLDDDAALLAWGEEEQGQVRAVPMQAGRCHHNASVLFRTGAGKGAAPIDLVTGYALSGRRWVRHSWGRSHTGDVLETTHERGAYFGLTLGTSRDAAPMQGSAWHFSQCHLNT